MKKIIYSSITAVLLFTANVNNTSACRRCCECKKINLENEKAAVVELKRENDGLIYSLPGPLQF
jgi:hypothetical protein